MRRRSGPIVAAIAGLLLAGCARRLPHGIAERYLENLRQFNYGACYQLLAQQDRTERTLPEFLTEIPLAPDLSPVWFRPVLVRMQFELGDEQRTRDGSAATVPVKITMPDLPVWERVLNLAAGSGGVTADAVQRSLDTDDYPKRVYEDKIFLIKEHHHWRVVAGFAARDRIVDQHRQAMNDYWETRYDQAIPEWRTMIAALREQFATGSLGLADRYGRELARIVQLQSSQADAQAYAAQVRLTNVAMKMADARVPGIFGTVTNSGLRPVDTVALAVTWYVGRGANLKAVHREDHSVVVTPVDFTDFTQPVVPLMPGEARPFGFILTAPRDVQQQASPYVRISAIALTDPALALHAAPIRRPAQTPAPALNPSSGRLVLKPLEQ
jgi:hypothetical protein